MTARGFPIQTIPNLPFSNAHQQMSRAMLLTAYQFSHVMSNSPPPLQFAALLPLEQPVAACAHWMAQAQLLAAQPLPRPFLLFFDIAGSCAAMTNGTAMSMQATGALELHECVPAFCTCSFNGVLHDTEYTHRFLPLGDAKSSLSRLQAQCNARTCAWANI